MSVLSPSEALNQLAPFSAVRGDIPVCDVQALMSYSFFSLAKTPRVKAIDYCSGNISVQVDASEGRGLATIWDADILIWAASQLVHAKNSGRTASRRIQARPYDILNFLGWGDSKRSYDRLRSALDRLKATRVTTSIGPDKVEGVYRFNWIDNWRECKRPGNRAGACEILLSEWFYRTASRPQSCLTLDRGYFELTGGLERWLFRMIRKHGGRQDKGWLFDLSHLHKKSGSLSSLSAFTIDLRNIAERGRLPGYELAFLRNDAGKEQLCFKKSGCGQDVNAIVLSGDSTTVLSGNRLPCYQQTKPHLSRCKKAQPGSLKIDSKIDSKIIGGSVVKSASREALAQRQNFKAFGSGIGARSTPHRSLMLKPSSGSASPFPPKAVRPSSSRQPATETRPARSSGPQRLLQELLLRKRIPLPGEPT